MSDLGSALSDSLSGLGGIFSGVGNAFSGVLSGANSGALTSNLVNDLTGGGAVASPTAVAQTTQAISNAIDPTGSIAASNAINPPNAAAVANTTGNVGGTESGGAPQPAQSDAPAPADTTADQDRASAAGTDVIRKLIAQLRGQSIDPYQAGATPGPGMSQGTGGVGSQGRGSEAPYGEGASSQGEYGRPPLNVGPGRGQQFLPQWQGGEGQEPVDLPAIPLSDPGRAAAAGQGAVEAATAPEAANVDLRELGFTPDSPPAGVPNWVSKAAGLTSPIGIAATVGPPAVKAAQEGVQKAIEQGEPVSSAWFGDTGGYVPPQAPQAPPRGQAVDPVTGQPTPLPHDDVGRTPTKKEYEDWLKAQGDPPSTAKKKADKSTPAERKKAVPPTKKADADKPPDYWVDDQGRKHEILPTKKPGERPYHMDEVPPGQSGMMRDVHGMQGVPQMLGQLAQLALPLLMMGMSGGFGGGRRGGDFRGFPFGHGGHGRFGGGPFHPGEHPGGHGSGMWPYHHEGMGWRGFGYHPGGGWRPWEGRRGGVEEFRPRGMNFPGGPGARFAYHHDMEMARRNAEMNEGGGDPGLQIIQALLGGGQQQGQGQQQQQGPQAGGGQGADYTEPQRGPWSDNSVYRTLVGAESGGRNSGAPGQGPGGDGGVARGYFNIQTPTWSDFAPNVPGASQYQTADQAPYEIQRAVANTIPVARFGDRTRAILHRKFGSFDERMTVGQLADTKGGNMDAAGGMTAGLPTGGGVTPTGDSRVAAQ